MMEPSEVGSSAQGPWLGSCLDRGFESGADSFFLDDQDLNANIVHFSDSLEETELFQLFEKDGDQQDPVPVMKKVEEEELAQDQPEQIGRVSQSWGTHRNDAQGSSAGEFSRKRILDHCTRTEEDERVKSDPEQQQQLDLLTQAQVQLQNQDYQSQQTRSPTSYNHMLAERNRRSRESELMTTLEGLILGHGTQTKKKKTKLSILEGAVDCIKQQKSQILQLQGQCNTATGGEQEVESLSPATPNPAGAVDCIKQQKAQILQLQGQCEQEVESLSPETPNPASMVTVEVDNTNSAEAGAGIQLTFEARQRPDIAGLLACLGQLGMELDSFSWMPESSPLLFMSVHQNPTLTTKDSSSLSKQDLHQALARSLFAA